MNLKRCEWATKQKYSKEMIKYHDKEWGVPVHSDKKLFELLILEGAQAGLSWSTIIKKRDDYKKAFYNFDFNRVSKMNSKDVSRLLKNTKIIRNKLKIKSTINNAKHFIEIRKEFGTFNNYIWNFVNYKPIINKFKSIKQIPTETELSIKISKDFKKRGFSFVGSKIIYAYMQAIGMVNDHTTNCFRYKQLK